MHPHTMQINGGVRAGVAGVAIAIASVLVLGVAGCAAQLNGTRTPLPESVPYVGVFTGTYVDGKPLYRFPAIYVVGSRSSVGDL